MTSLRESFPYLTRFERARVLSERAEQISKGAPPLTSNIQPNDDPLRVAMKELVENKIPLSVRRIHSDRETYEDVPLSELETDPTGEIAAILRHER